MTQTMIDWREALLNRTHTQFRVPIKNLPLGITLLQPIFTIVFAAFSMASVGVPVVGQTVFYVSNSGSNANDGLTPESAVSTIQHVIDNFGLLPGDTVLVQDGIYAGFDYRGPGGTSSHPISFVADGSNVILNLPGPIRDDIINIEGPNHVIIDGFTTRDSPFEGNGIRVVLSDFCIVRNNFCDNNGQRGIFTAFTDDIIIENNICSNSFDEHGIYVSNSSDRSILRFNECYGNTRTGIQINADLSAGGDGISSDPEIYGNILYDNNLGAGINLDGVERAVIYNNLIFNNHNAQGIVLFQTDGAIMSYGAKIYNNTIIVPSDGRWGILLQPGSTIDTEIYNNIILTEHAFRGCIAAFGVTGLSSDHNIVNDRMSGDDGDGSVEGLADWQQLGLDANSQLADSQPAIFTNPDGNLYTLLENSQAVDTGTDLVSAIVADDLAGNSRPSGSGYDVGAYEYVENCILGDVNLDGVVNLLDVIDFVDQLSNQKYSCEADVDQSGTVNLIDVAPFVALLSGS